MRTDVRRQIRTVVMEVAGAAGSLRDVSPELRERAEAATDPVKKVIFQVAADERFTGTALPRRDWQAKAEEGLVRLADELEQCIKTGVDDEVAIHDLIEEYFIWWLSEMMERRTFVSDDVPDLEELPFLPSAEDAKKVFASPDLRPRTGDENTASIPRDKRGDNDSEITPEQEDASRDNDLQEACNRFMKPPRDHVRDPDNNLDGAAKIVRSEKACGKRLEMEFLHCLPRKLYQLARIIGRSDDKPMFSSNGKFLTASKSDIVGITVGNNLNALLPSEIATLATPQSESVFYRNYAEKRLQVFASASSDKDPKKHEDGPIIICLDTSSSMNGSPVRTATAVTLALAILARRKEREVLIVRYSNSYDMMVVKDIFKSRSKLIHFLTHVDSSGNNENVMFRWLFREVLPQFDDFKMADMLCVSDFGWTKISGEIRQWFDYYREKGMRFYGLNIGNYRPDEKVNLTNTMDVLDSVWTYWRGNCFESYKKKGFRMKP